MPMSVRCPGCYERFTIPDDVVGKTIRCKKCEETFKAKPDDEEKRTVKKTRYSEDEDDDDDADDRPRRSASKVKRKQTRQANPQTLVFYILGAVALFGVIFGIAYAAGSFVSKDIGPEPIPEGPPLGQLKYGVPPALVSQDLDIAEPRIENNIAIFRYTFRNKQVDPRSYTFVILGPAGVQGVLPILENKHEAEFRLPLRAGALPQLELWVGKYPPGANTKLAPPRMSNVARCN
jgi:predicted Zn finger-like uncharacterized protein